MNKDKDVEIDHGKLSQSLDLEDGELQTQEEMLAQSNVTDDDIAAAKKAWRKNPPDKKYKNILDSKVVEE